MSASSTVSVASATRYAPTVLPRDNVPTRLTMKRPLQQITQSSCVVNRCASSSAPLVAPATKKKMYVRRPVVPAAVQQPDPSAVSAAFRRTIPPVPEVALTDYCYQSYDPKAHSFESQDFSSKFKCVYEGCQKIVSNNVSLMFHLWAHVVRWQPEGDGNSLSDVHKLCMCPQCLHIFPSPFRLQMHFNNVHGRRASPAACEICEITVDVRKHYMVHQGADAPYHCKKCRYRTSSRTQLLDHFVKFHKNTRTLLCPFCLLVFSVPKDVNRAVVSHHAYTAHIHEHQTSKHFKCEQCSLKFVKAGDKTVHKKDHTKRNPKWDWKKFKRNTRRKGRYLWPRKRYEKCVGCSSMIERHQDHFRGRYFCEKCPFETSCNESFVHHRNACCTKYRAGFTRRRLMKSIVECSNCGRKSCDPQFLEHIHNCSGGAARICETLFEEPDGLSVMQEQLEMRLFALREMEELKDEEPESPQKAAPVCLETSSLSPTLEGATQDVMTARIQFMMSKEAAKTGQLAALISLMKTG